MVDLSNDLQYSKNINLNKNILDLYIKNNLIYINYPATIIEKENGIKKIKGSYPQFSKITKQINYPNNYYNYFSLLMGREYKDGYLILIDADNKSDKNTKNGLEFINLLSNVFNITKVPCQETPSGGLHFLFYIDSNQKNINNSYTTLTYNDIIYNVDIKFKNQLMNCSPSQIEDYGCYKWININLLDNIPKLPDTLYNIIISNNNIKINTKDYNLMVNINHININKILNCYNNSNLYVYINDVNLLLSCLKPIRIINYDTWIQIGLLIYSLNLPFELWYEISKLDSKCNKNDCEYRWEYFSKKCYKRYNIGTLFLWVKHDNLDKFNEIKNKLTCIHDVFNDTTIYNSIKINTQYLVSKDSNNNDQEIFKNTINEFRKNDIKSLVIKSHYNSGKSTFIHNFIKNNNFKRILFISHRITLCEEEYSKFKDLGFVRYNDGKCAYQSDRLIVQLDSLLNVKNFSNSILIDNKKFEECFDLIILDEVESIIYHFNGSTMKDKAEKTFNFMTLLLQNSKKNILLDGDISHRSLNFISNIDSYIYIENTYKPTIEKTKYLENYK